MTDNVILPYKWTPRDYQKPLWDYLARGGTRAVTVWPRRHGKDDVYMRHTSCAMGGNKKKIIKVKPALPTRNSP